MLQIKMFYVIESYGKESVAQIEKEVNAFLEEISPNKVISLHPTMSDVPETENTGAYTSFGVMVVYEANEYF